jgi:hypothetical protein
MMLVTKFYYCLNPNCHFIFKAEVLDPLVSYCPLCPKCHGTNTIDTDKVNGLLNKKVYNTYIDKNVAKEIGELLKEQGLISNYEVKYRKDRNITDLLVQKISRKQVSTIKEHLNRMKNKYNSTKDDKTY